MIDVNVKVTVGLSEELAAMATEILAVLRAPAPASPAVPRTATLAGVEYKKEALAAVDAPAQQSAPQTATAPLPEPPAAVPETPDPERVRLIIEGTRTRLQGAGYEKGTAIHKNLTVEFKRIAEAIHPGLRPTELSGGEITAFARDCDALRRDGDMVFTEPPY